MQNDAELQKLRDLRSRGSIALDWSYIPVSYKENGEHIIPRLLLAVDCKSGNVLGSDMLSPGEAPCIGLFDMISHISYAYAKPAVIEICDKEIESCIADFCQRVGIRLVMKKQIKVITQARSHFWEK